MHCESGSVGWAKARREPSRPAPLSNAPCPPRVVGTEGGGPGALIDRPLSQAALRRAFAHPTARIDLDAPSLRAQRSNPEPIRGDILDCVAALAMTWGYVRELSWR